MQSPIETALVMQQDGDTSTMSTASRDDQQIHIEEHLLLKMKEFSNKLNRATRLQQRQQAKMTEMNGQIIDLRRRLDESDSKNREITAKIGQLIAINPLPDTTAGSTGSSSSSGSSGGGSTGNDGCNDAATNRFRNIKPRSASATIILKRLTEDNDLSTKCTIVKRPKLE